MKKINLVSYNLTKLTIDNEIYSIFDGVANFGGKINLNCCSIDLDTDLAYDFQQLQTRAFRMLNQYQDQ
jgi:hypothetical protein